MTIDAACQLVTDAWRPYTDWPAHVQPATGEGQFGDAHDAQIAQAVHAALDDNSGRIVMAL